MKPTYRAGNLLIFSDLTLGPLSRSNDGSLALVSCLFGGYKFALFLRCVDLVILGFLMADTSSKRPKIYIFY